MFAAHGGGHGQGLPRSLLSGTLPSHGASAVARVSDRGRVAEVLCTLYFVLCSVEARVCVFITAGPMIKLCAGGEVDREGHVL